MMNIIQKRFSNIVEADVNSNVFYEELAQLSISLSFYGVSENFLEVDYELCKSFFIKLLDILPLVPLSTQIDILSVLTDFSYFHSQKPVSIDYEGLKKYAVDCENIGLFSDILEFLHNVGESFSIEWLSKISENALKKCQLKNIMNIDF